MKITYGALSRYTPRCSLVLAAAIIFFGNSQRVIAQWSTNGTNVYYNGGNVGIGTNSPNLSGVGSALTLNGASDFILEWAVGGVRKGNVYHTGTDMQLFNNANGALKFGTNNTERMRIDAGGNVGIGTASPTNAKVEIKLGTGPSDASMYGLALSTSATNFPTKGRIASSFDGLYLTQNAYYNGSAWAVDDPSRSTAKIVLTSYVPGESSIMFATAAANNVPDPPVRMTIDKNGNLGIGTTSPTNPFTLNKPGASIIGNWYNLGAFIEPTNNKGIHLGYDNSSQTGLIISGSNGPASNLAFWTFNGSAWGERMRLDSSGNVGIGTSSPQYKLDVAGNINSNATITGNNIVAKYQDVAEWVPASE